MDHVFKLETQTLLPSFRHIYILQCPSVHLDEDGLASPPSETSEDTCSSEDAAKLKDEGDSTAAAGESKPDETAENNSENVLVIDTTFTCQVVAPGVDPFDIKVH